MVCLNVVVRDGLFSFDNRAFRTSHTHPMHIHVVVGIVSWELSLQIMRSSASIDMKLAGGG